MAKMIIDRDEIVLIFDTSINKDKISDIVKEIPDNTTKVNILGDLDNILGLLLALDQERYFINVDGRIPFDELFKSYDGMVFFPAWMELADTYTDRTTTPASVFDVQQSIAKSVIVPYKKYIKRKWSKKDL